MNKGKKENYSKFVIASIIIAFLPIILIILGISRFFVIPLGRFSSYLSLLILIISLILGFIGLKESKEKKLKRKWFAVIGIIISIFLLVFLIYLIIGSYNIS